MKSQVRASTYKQFEYTSTERIGKKQEKRVVPTDNRFYRPTGEERKTGRRVEVICKNCGFILMEMTIANKKDWRTKWWDAVLFSLLGRNGNWYGVLDHNVNYHEKNPKLPHGFVSISCCCGNSERDFFGLPVDKKLQKGFRLRYKRDDKISK